jgi:hypothetical protein
MVIETVMTTTKRLFGLLTLGLLLAMTTPVQAEAPDNPTPGRGMACNILNQTLFEYIQCQLGRGIYDAVNATYNEGMRICRLLTGEDCQDVTA